MATIRLFVVLLLLCCFTAKASTNGEQTYRLLFKSGDVIWIGQDIGGEYELSMLHQVTVTDKGAADGQSMLRAYGNWTFAADLKNVFRTDLVMALKPLDDHAWGHSDLDWTVRAPATDASLTEQFFAHVHDGGSNAQTFYAAQKSPTKHPPAVSVKAAPLLFSDHGLFFNYTIDAAWYFPRSRLLLVFTHQPTKAVGLDTMHGFIVMQLNEPTAP